MPGGVFDSSKTRVAPVFDALEALGNHWVPQLLSLVEVEGSDRSVPTRDLTFVRGRWGNDELSIPPPVALLSWLIRHPERLRKSDSTNPDRKRLLLGDIHAVGLALDQLRKSPVDRAWYILEGPTVPDVWIETPDAIVVIEGKRTEAGPTTDTSWLVGRHQIWRHIDAAWERRGSRKVFGFFVVEGKDRGPDVPALWRAAVSEARSDAVLGSSLPHRGNDERAQMAACLLGVTTWQRIVQSFSLPVTSLVERVKESR